MTSLARLEQQIELASAAVAKVQVKNGGDRVPSGEIEHEMQSFQLVLEKSKAQLEDLKNRLKERTREKGTARRNKDEEQEIVAEVSAERVCMMLNSFEIWNSTNSLWLAHCSSRVFLLVHRKLSLSKTLKILLKNIPTSNPLWFRKRRMKAGKMSPRQKNKRKRNSLSPETIQTRLD